MVIGHKWYLEYQMSEDDFIHSNIFIPGDIITGQIKWGDKCFHKRATTDGGYCFYELIILSDSQGRV